MPVPAVTTTSAKKSSSRAVGLAIVLSLAAVPAPQAEAAQADAVARGAYLAAAAGCDQCHTDTGRGGRPYAGGRVFATGWGTVVSPNITPDRATGIGGWRATDFSRALRWGIAPDDSHYLPVFPFAFYNRLSDGDIADLWAFLGSLAPVQQQNAAGGGGPFAIDRSLGAVAIAAQKLSGHRAPDPGHDASSNRGAYLVATSGRCGDCHTPRTLLGAPDPDRLLAGAGLPGGKKVPNITPDKKSGIGNWSEDDIVGVLTDGHTPDFDFVGGAMAEIVKNTSRLSEEDRRAVAIFLHSVPAVSSPQQK
jgi:mono/diheme cytochrome c family protein